MRLLIRLRAEKNQCYDFMYHHKMQGFIYNLLRDSGYGKLHDKRGYKFFSFSNIFPIKDMEEGETANFIIASPDRSLVLSLKAALDDVDVMKIGEMSFDVVGVKELEIRLKRHLRLLTATPLIIRIPERNYERYGIPENERKARYVYWRPKYSFEAFVKQLTENLVKKFNEFYGTDVGINELFERFVFRRTTATNVVIGGRDHVMVGSMWEFIWHDIDGIRRKIIAFGMDTGFGERNSLGFGFVNSR